jgi:hypothetical protein
MQLKLKHLLRKILFTQPEFGIGIMNSLQTKSKWFEVTVIMLSFAKNGYIKNSETSLILKLKMMLWKEC